MSQVYDAVDRVHGRSAWVHDAFIKQQSSNLAIKGLD
jgi:hypothetical protein